MFRVIIENKLTRKIRANVSPFIIVSEFLFFQGRKIKADAKRTWSKSSAYICNGWADKSH